MKNLKVVGLNCTTHFEGDCAYIFSANGKLLFQLHWRGYMGGIELWEVFLYVDKKISHCKNHGLSSGLAGQFLVECLYLAMKATPNTWLIFKAANNDGKKAARERWFENLGLVQESLLLAIGDICVEHYFLLRGQGVEHIENLF